MSRYLDADGDTWETQTTGRLRLVGVKNESDTRSVGIEYASLSDLSVVHGPLKCLDGGQAPVTRAEFAEFLSDLGRAFEYPDAYSAANVVLQWQQRIGEVDG